MSKRTFAVGSALLGLVAYVAYHFLSLHRFPKEAEFSWLFFGSAWTTILFWTMRRPAVGQSFAYLIAAVGMGAFVVIKVSLRHWGEWNPAVVAAIISAYFLAWLFLGSLAWDIRRTLRKAKKQ